jgi:hypothetical protein
LKKKKRCKKKECVTINKIIIENFSNLKKIMPIHEQETSRTPNRPDQSRTTP